MHQTELGLPPHIQACLFDLDGVLTDTAPLHAKAWKRMFDAFLAARAQAAGLPWSPFDIERDFEQYIDGRLRDDGTRAFLRSRNIELPEGTTQDTREADTIQGLSKRKNEVFRTLLREDGVQAYPGSLQYLRAVRRASLRTAVVSSSKNCHDVLASAGIVALFDARIDGVVAAERHLAGKPAPDTFLAAADALAVPAARAAVFEDAQVGVAAGRKGGFGLVVGVDRVGQAEALREHGADVVVDDLSALLEAT